MQEFDSRLWRELQADERKGSAESPGRGSQERGHVPWTVGAVLILTQHDPVVRQLMTDNSD